MYPPLTLKPLPPPPLPLPLPLPLSAHELPQVKVLVESGLAHVRSVKSSPVSLDSMVLLGRHFRDRVSRCAFPHLPRPLPLPPFTFTLITSHFPLFSPLPLSSPLPFPPLSCLLSVHPCLTLLPSPPPSPFLSPVCSPLPHPPPFPTYVHMYIPYSLPSPSSFPSFSPSILSPPISLPIPLSSLPLSPFLSPPLLPPTQAESVARQYQQRPWFFKDVVRELLEYSCRYWEQIISHLSQPNTPQGTPTVRLFSLPSAVVLVGGADRGQLQEEGHMTLANLALHRNDTGRALLHYQKAKTPCAAYNCSHVRARVCVCVCVCVRVCVRACVCVYDLLQLAPYVRCVSAG